MDCVCVYVKGREREEGKKAACFEQHGVRWLIRVVKKQRAALWGSGPVGVRQLRVFPQVSLIPRL